MTKLETNIIINASVETVWDILLDFEAYPSWNPFIQKISFDKTDKKKLDVLIAPPNGSAMKFNPQIIVDAAHKEFAWLGKLGFKGLFDGYHSFHLEKVRDEQTLFKQNEQFTGLLVPLFKSSLQTKTLMGFHLMNEALKKRAEQIG